MKKLIYVLMILMVFYSCKNKTNKEEDNSKINTVQDIESNPEVEYLSIVGDQIWVRSEPSTGDVVLKLDNGTKCILLEKGEKQTIKGVTDFWYKIEYDGKEGWVFGSQTSVSQNIAEKVVQGDDLEAFLSGFLKNIKDGKINNLKTYFVNDSLYELYNPGVFIYVVKVQYEEAKLFTMFDFKVKSFNGNFIVGREPVFDMELYDWPEKGCFINEVDTKDVLTQYIQWSPEVYDDYFVADAGKLQTYITHKLLVTDGDGVLFYIGKVNGEWKIIAVDDSTNDA
ncbi:MAG: SH3 domain-containing protein [Bacteroidales bacterium]|nr:SH3 domain-containing protein [Bacteroidales bacterium]